MAETEFELDDLPGLPEGMDPAEYVVKTGRIFQAGVYPDKEEEYSEDDLDQMVRASKISDGPPIEVVGHHEGTPLDGVLGRVIKLWRRGPDLFGSVAIRKWAADAIEGMGKKLRVSVGIDRDPLRLAHLALTDYPRVPSAVIMSNFAEWANAYMNDLPDSAFLYVEAGGEKNGDGKTTPRSLRHFPYKDASGKVDLPHLRNALARIPQSSLPDDVKEQATGKAKKILAGEKEDMEIEMAMERKAMMGMLGKMESMMENAEDMPDEMKSQIREHMAEMRQVLGGKGEKEMSNDAEPSKPTGGGKPLGFSLRKMLGLAAKDPKIGLDTEIEPGDLEVEATPETGKGKDAERTPPVKLEILSQYEDELKKQAERIEQLEAAATKRTLEDRLDEMVQRGTLTPYLRDAARGLVRGDEKIVCMAMGRDRKMEKTELGRFEALLAVLTRNIPVRMGEVGAGEDRSEYTQPPTDEDAEKMADSLAQKLSVGGEG